MNVMCRRERLSRRYATRGALANHNCLVRLLPRLSRQISVYRQPHDLASIANCTNVRNTSTHRSAAMVTVSELKEKLAAYGDNGKGLKADLIKRLAQFEETDASASGDGVAASGDEDGDGNGLEGELGATLGAPAKAGKAAATAKPKYDSHQKWANCVVDPKKPVAGAKGKKVIDELAPARKGQALSAISNFADQYHVATIDACSALGFNVVSAITHEESYEVILAPLRALCKQLAAQTANMSGLAGGVVDSHQMNLGILTQRMESHIATIAFCIPKVVPPVAEIFTHFFGIWPGEVGFDVLSGTSAIEGVGELDMQAALAASLAPEGSKLTPGGDGPAFVKKWKCSDDDVREVLATYGRKGLDFWDLIKLPEINVRELGSEQVYAFRDYLVDSGVAKVNEQKLYEVVYEQGAAVKPGGVARGDSLIATTAHTQVTADSKFSVADARLENEIALILRGINRHFRLWAKTFPEPAEGQWPIDFSKEERAIVRKYLTAYVKDNGLLDAALTQAAIHTAALAVVAMAEFPVKKAHHVDCIKSVILDVRTQAKSAEKKVAKAAGAKEAGEDKGGEGSESGEVRTGKRGRVEEEDEEEVLSMGAPKTKKR